MPAIPEQPFIVPDFETLSVQAPSPRAGCVVTLERLMYAWAIREYTEPLSWNREWMYDDSFSRSIFPGIDSQQLALSEFIQYIDPNRVPHPTEPDNWTRAVDLPSGKYRVRRARIEIDGSRAVYDTTKDEPL